MVTIQFTHSSDVEEERSDVEEERSVIYVSGLNDIGKNKVLQKVKVSNDLYQWESSSKETQKEAFLVSGLDDNGQKSNLWQQISGYFVLKNNEPGADFRLPTESGKNLFPHQRDGIAWLWSVHKLKRGGGILADDMGLGKTKQICCFLYGLFEAKLIQRVIIIAPKTLLSCWTDELSSHDGLSSKIKSADNEDQLRHVIEHGGILLATYGQVRERDKPKDKSTHGQVRERDKPKDKPKDKSTHGQVRERDNSKDKSLRSPANWKCDYLIMDEGHCLKNLDSKTTISVLKIECTYPIIISGTPIENGLKDLWALYSICNPKLFPYGVFKFKEKIKEIAAGRNRNAIERTKMKSREVSEEIKQRIKPFFLRRTKDDVLTLPVKHEMVVWLKLSEHQRMLHKALVRSPDVVHSKKASHLTALQRVRNVCDHPSLLTASGLSKINFSISARHKSYLKLESYIRDKMSCKLEFIKPLLNNLVQQEHSVLVFSHSLEMLTYIQLFMEQQNYKFYRIDGSTSKKERLEYIKAFNSGAEVSVFLLSVLVGAQGLTLTQADRVILVEPDWKPSCDSQAVDRAYRIGQKKEVIVYRLLTCGSLEEKMYIKQLYKTGLAKSITENFQPPSYFNEVDHKSLYEILNFDTSEARKRLPAFEVASLKEHISALKRMSNVDGISNHSLLFRS